MKLKESRLRSIIREELQRLDEMGGQNLHGMDMHPMDFGKSVADALERETGRSATYVPANRQVSGSRVDLTDDSVVIFEGMTQNLFVSLESMRGGVSGHIRTASGDMLRSFDTGQADPQAVASRAASALRDVGEL